MALCSHQVSWKCVVSRLKSYRKRSWNALTYTNAHTLTKNWRRCCNSVSPLKTRVERCNSCRSTQSFHVRSLHLCILNAPSWQRNTMSYTYHASVAISIDYRTVVIDCRWCKNISASFQHVIYSLPLSYISFYPEKELEQIGIQFKCVPLLSPSSLN
jgi:hypothetical protein